MGDGYEQIKVLGKHRGERGGLVRMVIDAVWVTNWRAQVVYKPEVLRHFRADGYDEGWRGV